ncbi:OLC1v1015521C1 [Oldenlandia corymbosa var. corymbosa]|uniref:OLC1v1015521C1 n=1 Tax=Oldenlandia corymbosa var. corymbosa TaxID=529605 RepID=A0AAV1E3X6_OLDCO|nr:OLC1v1015521C1 [Oldenlandia corymbosa var. corymbosa]
MRKLNGYNGGNGVGAGGANGGGVARNGGVSSDHNTNSYQHHVSIGIRSSGASQKQQSRYGHHHHNHHHRRLIRVRKISIVTALLVFLVVAFVGSISAFIYLSSKDKDIHSSHTEDDELGNYTDFLVNVTRTNKNKDVKFGHGSVKHGRDSRYWDGDDRRRDEDYHEGDLDGARDSVDDSVREKAKKGDKKAYSGESNKDVSHRGQGLYNEAGRNELKMYEAEYESSLDEINHVNQQGSVNEDPDDDTRENADKMVDPNDEYDDGIDIQDVRSEDDDDDEVGHINRDHSGSVASDDLDGRDLSELHGSGIRRPNEEIDEMSSDFSDKESHSSPKSASKVSSSSKHASLNGGQSSKKSASEKRSGSKKKAKRHSCEMKLLNATALLVEPLESRKFSRFSLQYTEAEEKPNNDEMWEPRFAGHQSLEEREESFIAHDQKINCGFVKGPPEYPSTGFDLAEDDAKFMSSCHIAVLSCIFGNSDRLRTPAAKTVSRLSRKNVCFVMFVDEITLRTLTSEGQMMDRMGFIGLWKVVLVKNLPYTDMRRVGKVPKFLSHRLFPSARYSIWLDSKLRLQLDPFLILEYFLWRKGHEYAISNHYDRHCLWEEVAQNKKLNKYNHTVIDQQFEFYQHDGIKRFNASDPNKLLPSNVPEGSFIVRAHTPMSNLFSCLWFNEVDRFTPRDQLSFAYTYYKLRKTNPEKPFYLNMFKDCERRKIAKLFRHRSEEKRNMLQHEIE